MYQSSSQQSPQSSVPLSSWQPCSCSLPVTPISCGWHQSLPSNCQALFAFSSPRLPSWPPELGTAGPSLSYGLGSLQSLGPRVPEPFCPSFSIWGVPRPRHRRASPRLRRSSARCSLAPSVLGVVAPAPCCWSSLLGGALDWSLAPFLSPLRLLGRAAGAFRWSWPIANSGGRWQQLAQMPLGLGSASEMSEEALADCRAAGLWWQFQRKPRILRGKHGKGPCIFVGQTCVGTFPASSSDQVSKVMAEILSALRPAEELRPLLEFWSNGVRLRQGSSVGEAPNEWTILPKWGTTDTCTVLAVHPHNAQVISFRCSPWLPLSRLRDAIIQRGQFGPCNIRFSGALTDDGC